VRKAIRVTIAALAVALSSPAFADPSVKIGELLCSVSSGLGLIVTSTRSMNCRYTSATGYEEHYRGVIRKFGLDIGSTRAGVLAWGVFAPTLGPRRHALAGDYVGVAASATAGAGVGANALVGGFGHSITLQPFSLETQTGLALSAGVASLTLRP